MNKSTMLRKRDLTNVGVRRWRVAPGPADASLPNMSVVRLVARTRLRPGVVVWARVPYRERDEYKIRPAVVFECRGRRDVVILPCTSSPSRYRYIGRLVELKHFGAAGLGRASAVRREAISIDLVDVLDVIGELSDFDADRVLAAAVVSRLSA
ncbi:type II toxin-antitoxin system PemK/MazF family toxin [Micromonospora sp. L32]|uniref:type II toxin-antitoxin system PemK/MazF family toxin n=1 Tax=Micromonospora sp. L32 TaxID=3452214 RepID=UPI003F8A04D1